MDTLIRRAEEFSFETSKVAIYTSPNSAQERTHKASQQPNIPVRPQVSTTMSKSQGTRASALRASLAVLIVFVPPRRCQH